MHKEKKRVVFRLAQVILSAFIALIIIGILIFVSNGREIPVLEPQGTIAYQQYILILITVGLGVLVLVPVFILLFTIAWRYRAGNKKAKYEPNLKEKKWMELLWWGIPFAIIFTLAVITWISTHALDPYKPLESNIKPVKVQVISLDWKWLFIYPEKGVATVNYMEIPEKTPIELSITSDAPMNSFWVPALAGQVYAMTGMTTKLHLMADTTGTYYGSTTNISGEGYADMAFKVYSVSDSTFNQWVEKSQGSSNMLTASSYNELAKQSRHEPEKTYMLMDDSLFEDVVMKYLTSGNTNVDKGEPINNRHDMQGMEMK